MNFEDIEFIIYVILTGSIVYCLTKMVIDLT